MIEALDGPEPAVQPIAPAQQVSLVMAELKAQLLSRLEALPLAPVQRKELARQVARLVDQAAGRLRAARD